MLTTKFSLNSPPDLSANLEIALGLADLADHLSMAAWRSPTLEVSYKADGSPVTKADKAIERAIRRTLSESRPQDQVFGEEEGGRGVSEWDWIIDPIDGTRHFITGGTGWATFISARYQQKTALAVVSLPSLGKRVWASQAAGPFCNGASIGVSACPTLDQARIVYSGERYFEATGQAQEIRHLLSQGADVQISGHAEGCMRVAEGLADLVITPLGSPWDFDAVEFIIKMAGGDWSNLQGHPSVNRTDFTSSRTGSGLGSNGLLHQPAVELLQSHPLSL